MEFSEKSKRIIQALTAEHIARALAEMEWEEAQENKKKKKRKKKARKSTGRNKAD